MCFIGLRLRLRFAEQELGSSDLYIVHASACCRGVKKTHAKAWTPKTGMSILHLFR